MPDVSEKFPAYDNVKFNPAKRCVKKDFKNVYFVETWLFKLKIFNNGVIFVLFCCTLLFETSVLTLLTVVFSCLLIWCVVCFASSPYMILQEIWAQLRVIKILKDPAGSCRKLVNFHLLISQIKWPIKLIEILQDFECVDSVTPAGSCRMTLRDMNTKLYIEVKLQAF